MVRVLSRTEWDAACAMTKREFPTLAEYAAFHSKAAAERDKIYPGVSFPNARYVSHLERVLKQGAKVPAEYLRTVSEDEFKYDWVFFPLLKAALEKVEV